MNLPSAGACWVLLVILATVAAFAADRWRVDGVSLGVLLALALGEGWIGGVLAPGALFSGFSSNAVLSLAAVMVFGAAFERSGMSTRLAAALARRARGLRSALAGLCTAAGLSSGLLQNTGAAALFIPVCRDVAERLGLPLRKLLLPVGFAAITGGTLTAVGSSPLILVNDLLPPGLAPLGLFEVTPVGLALLAVAVAYLVAGAQRLLPAGGEDESGADSALALWRHRHGLHGSLRVFRLAPDSPLAGLSVADVEATRGLRVVGLGSASRVLIEPAPAARVEPGASIALFGPALQIAARAAEDRLLPAPPGDPLARALHGADAAPYELLVPPDSPLIGESARTLRLRDRCGLTLLALRRGAQRFEEDAADQVLQPGDILLCLGEPGRVAVDNEGFIVLARPPGTRPPPHGGWRTLGCLGLALALLLFSPLPLGASLLCGAVALVATGVLEADAAYRAVHWPTLVLMGGLIPLGLALRDSGAADWLVGLALPWLGQWGPVAVLALTAAAASLLSVAVSNVGAAVVMLPLVLQVTGALDLPPRPYLLAAAVCCSNGFLLPTHQVNALVLRVGGYAVRDLWRAGLGLTLLFAATATAVLSAWL